jgi:hypothetical protein
VDVSQRAILGASLFVLGFAITTAVAGEMRLSRSSSASGVAPQGLRWRTIKAQSHHVNVMALNSLLYVATDGFDSEVFRYV